jgi:hypothetical protein
MKGRIGYSIALGIGVLLVAGGLFVRFVFLPSQAQFPDDVDSTRTYTGTLEVMLNQEALAQGDFENLFIENVPITLERHVTTEETEGEKALVREQAKMTAPDGTVLQQTDDWYTIDRKSMEHIANFTANANVQEQRQGLVIGFPIGTDPETYQGWSDDYQTTMPVEFIAEEEILGGDTYHFRSASGPQEITDPEMLAMFPPAFPKDLVVSLAPTLVGPEMQEQLGQLLPMLPDPVPFGYMYEYQTDYWVEPATGVLIDYEKTEVRQIALRTEAVPGGLAPLGPVMALTYEHTDQSIDEATDDAEDGIFQLRMFGSIVPWGAVGLGALFIIWGGYEIYRKREQ